MKHTRLVILGLVVSLIGQSCGPSSSSQQTTLDPFPKDKITITIWSPYDDINGYAQAAGDYVKAHKNVSFTHKQIDAEKYETELVEALANGSGPDIFLVRNDNLPAFTDKISPMPAGFFPSGGIVSNLSSQYAPAVAHDVIFDGQAYGIPLYTNTLVLFFNQKIFDATLEEKIVQKAKFNRNLLIRPPADWSEVVEVTKLITKRDGNTITQAGMALGTSNNIPLTADIIPALMLQQGTAMVSEDRKNATFHLADNDDPTFYPGAAVMNFLKGFTEPSSPYYSWNATQPDAVQAFLDGKLGMMINDVSIIPYLRQRNPNLGFGTAPLPQIANTETIVDYARYEVHTVSKDSKHPEVMWDFLANLQKSLASYTRTTRFSSPLREVPATTTVAARRFKEGQLELQLPTAQSWFKGKQPRRVDEILMKTLDDVTVRHQDPRQAVEQAAKQVTELLEDS